MNKNLMSTINELFQSGVKIKKKYLYSQKNLNMKINNKQMMLLAISGKNTKKKI